MAMSLRELESEIKEIHEGMLYMRRREEEMRNVNEATNSRVAWMSVMSLGICVGMSVWQVRERLLSRDQVSSWRVSW
jgi:phosphatidylinositol glycan class A protein